MDKLKVHIRIVGVDDQSVAEIRLASDCAALGVRHSQLLF